MIFIEKHVQTIIAEAGKGMRHRQAPETDLIHLYNQSLAGRALELTGLYERDENR